jgi:hypothetical protein
MSNDNLPDRETRAVAAIEPRIFAAVPEIVRGE